MEKCFETTEYPSQSLKSKWALILTEKRLRNIKSSPESKENLTKVWLPQYVSTADLGDVFERMFGCVVAKGESAAGSRTGGRR